MAIKSKVAIEIEIKNIKRVADLKKELKALRKEQRESEKQASTGRFTSRKQEKQYLKTARVIGKKSKSLRELNKNLRKSTTDTTKTTKSSNGMAKQFVKAAAAIGIVIGAFRAVNRIVSSVVSVFTEFEFVMAKVNAVSGATQQEFGALTATAEELGRTTFFTATQVGELMLNYSKLGFTAAEIQDAVKPTLDLATATGSDLARAALVAGAAVRGFGLDASETTRVVDVMAVSFSSSAMNIEKWQTSMTKVAPIAKAAGFSIEDTAAIMSKLTDSGIEASIAGTSLRNILLKMQDPSSDLTKAFGTTIHSLDELVPAMKKFVKEGGSMADVMEVVDLRQAAAFEQMLTTADGTLALRDALLDANGEGARMAGIVGDTLQGALLKLTSAAQGFGISFMKNFSGSLQKGIESAAEFLNGLTKQAAAIATVVKGLITLIKFLGIYKTVQLAATAATIAFELATKTATMSTKRFIVSFRSLTATMMANPYVAVGALLIALATDLFNLRNQVEETDDSWQKMNNTIFGDIKKFEKRQSIINNLKDEFTSLEDVRKGRIALNELNKDVLSDEESMIAQRIQLEKNAQSIFREGEEFMMEAYVARGMEAYKAGINLKKEQQAELKLAIAIGETTAKKRDAITPTAFLNTAKSKSVKLTESELQALRDYVRIMQEVIDGKKDEKVAERELLDLAIQRAEKELENIPLILIDNEEKYLKILKKIIDLKRKREEQDDKTTDKELKNQRKLIKEYSKLGGALQTVAGDNEKLNGIREAGEAITKAAAVAEALLTLRKTLGAIAEGELTLATVFGTAARKKDIVTTVAATGATTAQTAVETASIVPKVASGAASQAKLPFPFNIIAIIATLAVLAKIMNIFEKGGIVDGKFANGGMVNGKSHAQGGEKFSVGGRVVELEGGEAVINKRSTAMYRGQLSAMNQAGGGVKFADGGLLNNPSFARQRFSGGQTSGGGMQRVYVVESDITSTQNTVDVLEASATI